MPDGLRVAAAVGARGGLLQANGRQVEQLVDEPRGDRVDDLLLLAGEATAGALELGGADLLRPGAERRDRRARPRARPATRGSARPPRRRSPPRARPPGGGRQGSRRQPTRGRRCRRGSSRRARGSPGRGRAARPGRSGTAAAPCARAAPPRRRRASAPSPARRSRRRRRRPRRARPRRARRQALRLRTAWPARRPAGASGWRRTRPCAPRAARLRAASSATWPAPIRSAWHPSSCPKTCCASAAAAEDTDAGLSAIAVSARTFFPACSAWRNTRSSTGPVVPASNAVRTWPRISPSPGTIESSPAATRKRCNAAASSASR